MNKKLASSVWAMYSKTVVLPSQCYIRELQGGLLES